MRPVLAVARGARSVAALLSVFALFIVGGAYQRLVVWPLVTLLPARRPAMVAAYMRGMSRMIFLLLGLGGARARRNGTLSTSDPVLLLSNHQSLLDIPTAILLSRPFPPLFVTRERYARFIPAVSLCLRLLGCPVIDPKRGRSALAVLRETARSARHGILIFPEGHRTQDGDIAAFRPAGTVATLAERRTPVYLVLNDGFWTCRRLVDFVFNIHLVDGQTEILGPFHPPDDDGALPAFVEELRQVMIDHLRVMRERRVA